MKIGVSAFSDGLDEAREGKRGVVTDPGSNLNTLRTTMERQQLVWGAGRRAGGQDQKIGLDILVKKCISNSM